MGSSYDTQQQEICHPMGRLSLTGSCLRKNTGVVVGCAPRTVGIPTHIMNVANRNTTRNPAPLPHRAPNSCCPVGSHMACELRWEISDGVLFPLSTSTSGTRTLSGT